MIKKYIICSFFVFVVISLVSCKMFDRRRRASTEFALGFNEDKGCYTRIKDFILFNNDSINTIRMYSDSICEISKLCNKDAFNNYIYASIEDSSIIEQNTRDFLYDVQRFMLEKDIAYIGVMDNKVQISFKYTRIPCFDLFWDNELNNKAVGVVIKYNVKDRQFWKYYLDSHWYIKGKPCFN